MGVSLNDADCLKVTYPKPSDNTVEITCFFCKLDEDLTAGEITKDLTITSMTLPAKTDLIIDGVYNGLSSETGEVVLYTSVPLTGAE